MTAASLLMLRRAPSPNASELWQMLRNTTCIGRIDCPEYGVSTRGDFEPLVSEDTFYR